MNTPLPTEGIVFIDKPTGWSSHDVVNWVRHQTGVKRVGHAGTLDPLATGLLIVLIGRESTKRQTEFLKMDKEYEVTGRLGVATDSYDSTGTVMNQADEALVAQITQAQLEQVVRQFVGSQLQRVPPYSAVKVGGRKLYAKARAQELDPAEIPSKTVTIHKLKLTQFQSPEFSLQVKCSSGTYIRSLVHDIGQQLGTGATVTQLRRTAIGNYSVSEALSLPAT